MSNDGLNGRKILVVEDDFSSRLYMNKLLERTGFEILNAADGREAYDLVMNDPAIKLVLMDIQLPVFDGYTCTRMLRDSGSEVIIIAQTAYGLTGDIEQMMSSGFNDFLIKPISQSQLTEKLSAWMK
jgi:CheY-like chemotaxis protein